MASSSDEPKKFNVLLCGFGGVGKSALMIRFATDHFFDTYDPTIEDDYRVMSSVDGVPYAIDVFESAGCEECSAQARREEWMKRTRVPYGILILHDITNRQSFDEVQNYVDEIRRTRRDMGKNDFPVILCGSKCDLAEMRQIQTEEGQDLANTLGCPFVELSSKTRQNLEQPFFELIRLYGNDNNDNPGNPSGTRPHGKCTIC